MNSSKPTKRLHSHPEAKDTNLAVVTTQLCNLQRHLVVAPSNYNQVSQRGRTIAPMEWLSKILLYHNVSGISIMLPDRCYQGIIWRWFQKWWQLISSQSYVLYSLVFSASLYFIIESQGWKRPQGLSYPILLFDQKTIIQICQPKVTQLRSGRSRPFTRPSNSKCIVLSIKLLCCL